jgi:L-ascorbate metabolism protein UlaG (beta-lactamase superfamily)
VTLDVTRRSLLVGAATGGLLSAAGPAHAHHPAAANTNTDAAAAAAEKPTMRWLGTAGWHLTIGGAVVLVDPYVSRFDTGLAAGSFDPRSPLRVDGDALRTVPSRAETILVTHTHWDHFNDVPALASLHGSRILGTSTCARYATALGAPATIVVAGGEVLDFGAYVVEVVSSLHSRGASYNVLFPGTDDEVPNAPATIADLKEGNTLAFVVGAPGGARVLVMGGSDFKQVEFQGLQPDVAAIPVASSDAVHDYVPRLLEALDRPSFVIPTHWDDFERPLANPPRATPAMRQRLDAFVNQVRRASPRTSVIVPEYLTPLDLS